MFIGFKSRAFFGQNVVLVAHYLLSQQPGLGRISFVHGKPFSVSPRGVCLGRQDRNLPFNWLYLFGFKKLYQNQKNTTKLNETESQVNYRSREPAWSGFALDLLSTKSFQQQNAWFGLHILTAAGLFKGKGLRAEL